VKENPLARPQGEGASAPGRWCPWLLVLLLLVVAGALYIAVPVAPFLPLKTAQKVELSGELMVAAEVVFWGAALFWGKEVISHHCRLLDPRAWLRKG
jgi:hypothetical protein